MKVVDFFCGAGGFSEGFRQAGFEIVQGIEINKTALTSFNFNFGTNDKPTDILEIAESIESINKYVADSHIIIGSPPCVSFSSSNKSGNADKSLGIQLIKAFLKIITVKRYKEDSILKAYFMENVVNSMNYLQDKNGFTFEELDLGTWCQQFIDSKTNLPFSPKDKAIIPYEDTRVLNSRDYGSFQSRKRAITAHIINFGSMTNPPQHKSKNKTLKQFFHLFASPFPHQNKSTVIQDPNYKNLSLDIKKVTDHFYDTRIHDMDAKLSQELKENHPYMGKMSFPENLHKSVRTITATKISMAREAIIFKAEHEEENSKYRLPTVREAACFMGFPITYQFKGSESQKWKQIGNAVCPTLSYVLANELRKHLFSKTIKRKVVTEYITPDFDFFSIENFEPKKILPTKKSKNARFRGHFEKKLNITITLANFSIRDGDKSMRYWNTSIQKGTGKGSFHYELKPVDFNTIENCIMSKLSEEENQILSQIKSQLKELNISKYSVENDFINRINSPREPNNLIAFISNTIVKDSLLINSGKRGTNCTREVQIKDILPYPISQNFKIEGDQLIALAIFISVTKALSK
jgi:DNA (cytosine-5)-methyltransferase 1